MTIHNYLTLIFIFFAVLISIEAGLYLVFRYQTRLARWAGLLLISQALELIGYLLHWVKPASTVNQSLYLIQVFAYTLFCIFWLLLVFEFTQHTHWIRPRNLAFLIALPTIYLLMLGVLWMQGPVDNYLGVAITGSLMFSPFANGFPGFLFIIFAYGIDIFSLFVLFQYYSRSDSYLRKLLVAFIGGPILLALVGVLELIGVNPFKPVSIHQLAITCISLLAFWVINNLRFTSMLSSAREMVVDQMQDGVLILDQQDRIVVLNYAAQQIFSPHCKNAVKKNLALIWAEGATLMAAARSGTNMFVGEVKIQVNGLEFTFDTNISQLLSTVREPIGWVIVLRNVTGRERMEKALIERSQEVERTNAYLAALAEVNLNLQTTTDPSKINAILGSELKKLGLVCFIAQLEPDSHDLLISYLSTPHQILGRIEKFLGVKLNGFRLEKDQFSKLYAILESNEISFEKFQLDDLADSPGKVPVILMEQAIRLIGLEPEMAALVLPLVTGERTYGLMGVWGPDLRKTDIAPFRIFANQVARVMEKAFRYETEIQRSTELARSNAMIIALSNVAAQLDTTTDLSQVLETLGNELEKIHVNCMVGTLDDAKQVMKVEHISLSKDVIGWAEKLGAFWSKDIMIPRRLWPTDRAVTEKEAYWDPDPIGSTSKMIPYVPKQLFIKAFEMAGMNPEDQMCYLPMISEEDVIGILAVWGHDLNHEDVPGLSVFANQVATAIRNTRLYNQAQRKIIERTQAEAHIQAALNEKEILLKEIHHRVKNNLQIISSLLNLQAAQNPDSKIVDALRESQNRVRSMALIHEKLYQSNDLSRIDFAGYLQSLVFSLTQTYRIDPEKVTIDVHCEKITLNIDTAVPCGLIVNELVSNSLKYAFPADVSGTIEVSCQRSTDDRYTFIVSDDGIGLPDGFDISQSSSLGLRLVTSLVSQIDGELAVDSKNGSCFEINFVES